MEWTLNSRVNPLTLTCDLASLGSWVRCFAFKRKINHLTFEWPRKFKGKSFDCDLESR